jgi:hypothetical protein
MTIARLIAARSSSSSGPDDESGRRSLVTSVLRHAAI